MPEHAPTIPSRNAPRAWVRLALILLGVSATISTLTCLDCLSRPQELLLNFGLITFYTTGLWLANGYSVDWLDHYVSWKQAPGKRLVLTVLVSLGGSLVVIILVRLGYVLYRGTSPALLFSKPYLQQYVFPLVVTALMSMFMHSRSFLLGWREALVSNERLQKEMAQAEKEVAQAEAASLRQQLDPHFMFNALNALTSLVEAEPKVAVRFIRQLSLVYRYVLDVRQREVVPLAEELAFARSYLFLQSIRHGEALQIELPAPETVPACFAVPPLSLQLLLENALKHNAASVSKPMHLRIALDAPARCLTVSNTLRPRRGGPDDSLGIGLPNLRARYGHLTAAPVRVERTDGAFVVILPLLELA